MIEHSGDAPRTVYRPATLGYRTRGSDGTRDEMHVCGKEAVSKENSLVSLRGMQVLPVNRGERRYHLFREIDGPRYNQVGLSPEDFGMEESQGTDQLRDMDFPSLRIPKD